MNEIKINKTLSEKISDILRDQILMGVLKPADRLLYSVIANEMGVSLSPVKEALLHLEQEGLVTAIPRKGVYVRQFSAKDIEDFSWVRLALESFAVEKICELQIPESDIESLRTINNELKEKIGKKDVIKCMHQDNLFHAQIIALSKNNYLPEIVKNFHLVNLSIVAGEKNYVINKGNHIYEIHSKIVDALSVGDAEGAKLLLRENIIEPINYFLFHYDSQP